MISIKKYAVGLLLGLSSLALLPSCNDDLEQIVGTPPIAPTVVSGSTLADVLNATASDSLFNKIVKKNASIVTLLSSRSNFFTLFVPDNAALIATYGSLAAANTAINAMSATTAASIVSYAMVPQRLPTSMIVHPFPNMQMPTAISIDPNPLIKLSSFPSRNPSNNLYYYNTAPLTSTDVMVANGVIHHTAFLVAPPSVKLKDLIAADPNLSYFRGAIARADSGQSGTNRFDSLLNYGVTNMTVLTPTNAAFRTALDTLIRRGLIATGVPPATAAGIATSFASTDTVFKNPALYGSITAATVRGIMAYHFLSSGRVPVSPDIRVFSVNIPSTPTFIKTLVNGSVAIHPGVMANATYTGPLVTALTFSGLGTLPSGGAPFSQPALVVGMDRHAVNGVTHTIDKVLLPQ